MPSNLYPSLIKRHYLCACGCGAEIQLPQAFCGERWTQLPVQVQAQLLSLEPFSPEWNALVSRCRKALNGAELW